MNLIYTSDTFEELVLNNHVFAYSNREGKVQLLLDALGLTFDYISYMKERNLGHNNPYHNTEHSYSVAINCALAGIYYHLSVTDMRTLFLAGLFHDFNHTGTGCKPDQVNIAYAKTAFVDLIVYLNMLEVHDDLQLLSKNIVSEVHSLISVTQYPFCQEPTTLSQKIIRDADLMHYTDDDAQVFIDGLSKELGVSLTWDSTKQFLQTLTIYTDWGRKKLSKILGLNLNNPPNSCDKDATPSCLLLNKPKSHFSYYLDKLNQNGFYIDKVFTSLTKEQKDQLNTLLHSIESKPSQLSDEFIKKYFCHDKKGNILEGQALSNLLLATYSILKNNNFSQTEEEFIPAVKFVLTSINEGSLSFSSPYIFHVKNIY